MMRTIDEVDTNALIEHMKSDPDLAAMTAVRRHLESGPCDFTAIVKACPDHDRGTLSHAVNLLWSAKRIRPAATGGESFELVPDWTPKYS